MGAIRGVSVVIALWLLVIGLVQVERAWSTYTSPPLAAAVFILTGGLWLARIVHVTKGSTR